ncbi:TolB family protein [Micromonospora humi]|uniref:WD40-like Beta Propeller Repeat n=1 Tax=Micromonospora humi TaxID=745366 RepID=A0A1C5GS30_9ACTN|nr:PD40 domain-containing protein [Micromonospora humi]SCG36588.1 WD40-like Beta Propeller Repeat [Micromonospora humi]
MTALNRRTLLRAATLTGAAAATGLAGGLVSAAPASAAEVVNGPWLVSVGWGVLRIDPGHTTPRSLLPDGDHAKTSPDGRYVAWVNNAWSGDGTLLPYVAVHDRVTGAKRTLLADPPGVLYGAPTWSPDGREIALVTGKDRDTLIAVDVATGGTRVLAQGHGMGSPDWSRDGSMIVMHWLSRSEGLQLRVLELATGTVRRLYAPLAGERFSGPVFTPDSQRVVFCTTRWYPDRDTYNQSLGSVRIGGDGLKKLTDEPQFYLSPVFSPDGRYCAALSIPPANQEYPDGGNITVFTRGFDAQWWIAGDEYDDSTRLDWARAI